MEEKTHTIEFSEKVFKLGLAIIAVTALFLIGQMIYQFKSLPQNAPHEITVSGEGKALVKPDIATISFGANTQGLKSQEVVNRNNDIMNAVIKSIKESGVEDKDIKTTFYNLTPIYDYTPRGGREFKGYSLDQQISVKIRNFDKISEILDKAAANGANTIGDLQFTVDDMEKIRAEARTEAIKNAKEKAMSLIGPAGLTIERVVSITEGHGIQPPQPFYGQAEAFSKDAASIAPQIQPGQMEVVSNVTLTYRVR
ncbi:MAG: hypothetical protein A3A98_00840 [Candidatus Staskawiczbacteria bacterium RIFCSPLOWO2_01_FULL_40_39]|uniref:SIMPL domain-containing protein n=1 Tax=Candidatus Staskawiczbacteria bacterium RIFCSPHIGHO2_01_FULL_39_25 TaxID=1802202 RepID=A0A1G2HN50_9BACT|nr:MAG: hypothetical protein A2730_00840 [Candidatus Staskawiczbacteria bacterium RIFCSPHIGHO2_01_FULL_39_25]OGZ73277.1 MAG: hypothetical protein A3A98_00840 [Candidatus Staskawiczbacteria bacterium RIFCSPLOWO2_01_FULL_40_39]OGZ75087.1 MAG: hypothetical protein A3I87_02735 [Candidatus Staskawiczbacteria bacterium RIFCSPLOWO2_02_FULL_39_8]